MQRENKSSQPVVDEPLYSVAQWAESAGISKTTAWTQVHNRQVGFYRIGRRVLIGASHRADYLKQREVLPFDAKTKASELLHK